MPARSFIGTIEDAARQFYATAMRGEVSDANVRGYLRAASKIAEIWQQIDQEIADTLAHGSPPWEAYRKYRYPLAFIRAARTYQVFVGELLAADAAADPSTAGYLPQVASIRRTRCVIRSSRISSVRWPPSPIPPISLRSRCRWRLVRVSRRRARARSRTWKA